MTRRTYTLTAATEAAKIGSHLPDDEVMAARFHTQAEAFHLADEITDDFDVLCVQLCRMHQSNLWEVLTDCL